MFWTNYERFCKSVGKSANAVAADIGIKSTGTVTGWKNGATPRRNVLLKLSDYFGCEIDELDDDETTRQHEADGLSDRISGLDADLQKQLIEFVELAQANPKTAKRFLSFALEELRSSAQGN